MPSNFLNAWLLLKHTIIYYFLVLFIVFFSGYLTGLQVLQVFLNLILSLKIIFIIFILEMNLRLAKSSPKRVFNSIITLCQHQIFAAIAIIIASAKRRHTKDTKSCTYAGILLKVNFKNPSKQTNKTPNKQTIDLFWDQQIFLKIIL